LTKDGQCRNPNHKEDSARSVDCSQADPVNVALDAAIGAIERDTEKLFDDATVYATVGVLDKLHAADTPKKKLSACKAAIAAIEKDMARKFDDATEYACVEVLDQLRSAVTGAKSRGRNQPLGHH
jgi:hypothetical protein